jgi:hypothetical protein
MEYNKITAVNKRKKAAVERGNFIRKYRSYSKYRGIMFINYTYKSA